MFSGWVAVWGKHKNNTERAKNKTRSGDGSTWAREELQGLWKSSAKKCPGTGQRASSRFEGCWSKRKIFCEVSKLIPSFPHVLFIHLLVSVQSEVSCFCSSMGSSQGRQRLVQSHSDIRAGPSKVLKVP